MTDAPPAEAKDLPRHAPALRFDAFGGPDVLRAIEAEVTPPAEGEALVRVHAASINPLAINCASVQPDALYFSYEVVAFPVILGPAGGGGGASSPGGGGAALSVCR